MDEAKLKADERARADAINASMAAMSRQQTVPTIPGISEPLPSPRRNGFYYAGFFLLAVAAHILGYLVYANFIQKDTTGKPALMADEITQPKKTQSYNMPPQSIPAPTPIPAPPITRPIIYNVYHQSTPSKTSEQRAGKNTQRIDEKPIYGPTDCENLASSNAENYYTQTARYDKIQSPAESVEINCLTTTEVISGQRFKTKGQAHITYKGSTGGIANTVRRFEIITEIFNGRIRILNFTEAKEEHL